MTRMLRVCLCSVMILWAAEARSQKQLPTPETVWADFDPEAGPLEEEILRQWTEAGARYKEVYFTALVNDQKVRVYAIYAAPEKPGKYPAVMHLHGGGQTVNLPWLKFWTGRGYAALTLNAHGKWPNRRRYTIYPESLKQGNHYDCGPMLDATEPSLKVCSWYIWAAVNRRAVTYLAKQQEVDAQRIGAFGVSMGGTTIWNVAIDKRLKAACAIYGIGFNVHQLFDEKYDTDRQRPEPTLHQQKWNSGMAPQAYPPYIRCPVLFLNASNDQHGNLDYTFDTMDRMPPDVPWRVAISPHFRHHIARAEGRNLLLWMDTWLKDGPKWPQTPEARLTLADDGVPLLTLKPDDSRPIERVAVYYNIGNTENKSRYWREVRPTQSGKSYRASLPTLDIDQHLFAFANVYYRSGICLSGRLLAEIPSKLGPAIATDGPSRMLYDGRMGLAPWTTESPGTDPQPPVPVPIVLREGPGGKRGIGPDNPYRRLMTYKIGDPKWRGPDGASLRFNVFSKSPQQIKLTVADKVVDHRAKEYSALVSLQGIAAWQTVTLGCGQFNEVQSGAALAAWKDMIVMWIRPPDDKRFKDADLIFTDFQWITEGRDK